MTHHTANIFKDSHSFITDASGEAVQHLQYLPFGESFVDQRSSSWVTPYTFSGKEKDTETGYSYFGARYYDSDLSVWLSVDPLSDKYPYQSPYSYVGGRAIMVTDPNGMWEKKNGKWVAQEKDSWWTLHEQSGMSWKETMAFAKKYNAARGKDNWKFVGVGDQVTLQGGSQESSSSGESTNTSQTASDNTNTTPSESTFTPPPPASGRCDYSPINVESFMFGTIAAIKTFVRLFVIESDIEIMNQGTNPKPSPKFKAPTNPAQLPPKKNSFGI